MIGTIVQARMTSTRLPGKTLIQLDDATVLEHVIRRVQQAQIGPIIVATSTDPTDNPIAEHAYELGVDCYRGSLNDLIHRYHNAALAHGIDPIVRVTADCPLLNVNLLQQVAKQARRYDYVGVKHAPNGTHAEAFTFHALALTNRLATTPYDREHVVTYMLERPAMFRQGWIHADADGPPVALDTPHDLERIRNMLADAA